MNEPLWVTLIEALHPETGEMCLWMGPYVPGFTKSLAQQWCNMHGLGYCRVHTKLVEEIPTKPDGVTPDWVRRIRVRNPQNN